MKIFHQVVIGILFSVMAQQGFSQMGKIDTKHLADGSFCVIRIDVERLINRLDANKKKELKDLSQMLRHETGLEIANMKVLTFQYSDFDVEEGMPGFAATFEMTSDFDQKIFRNKFSSLQNTSEATHNGKSYFKAENKYAPNFYFESKQKFTVATSGAIETILESGSGMGKLASAIHSAPPGSEFILAFNRTPKFADSMKGVIDDLDSLQMPIGLKPFIKDAKSGFAYFDLTSGNPLRLKLEFQKKAVASEAKAVLEQYLKLGKTLIPLTQEFLNQQIKSLEGDDEFANMQKDSLQMGLQGLEIASKILGGATCSTQENVVNLKVTHMGGLKGVEDLVFDGFKFLVLGVAEAPRKGKIEEAN